MRLEGELLAGNIARDARQWARELGVDTRTFQRDLRFLRQARGHCIIYDQRLAGYRLERPKPASMERDEDHQKKSLALLRLVHLITAQPGLTASKLASEMKCSTRTFQRYRRDLEEMGLPIYNDRGYRFAADAFLPPLGLAPDELLSLFLGARLLETEFDTEAGPAARQAMEKLVRAMSESKRPDITAWRETIQISSPTEDTGAGHLVALQAAVGNGRQLAVSYLGLQDAKPQERIVDPMGIFGFRHVWYLRAYDHRRADYRNFRLSRIESWRQLDAPVVKAPQMRLSDSLYHRWDCAGKAPVNVVLQISAPLARWLMENPPHPSQQITDREARYQVSDLPAVARWAASLHGLEVLEPNELREEMAKLGQELTQTYASPARITR